MARLGRGQPNRPALVRNGREDVPGRLAATASVTTLTVTAPGAELAAAAPTAALAAITTP